jgi:hypothetical protein
MGFLKPEVPVGTGTQGAAKQAADVPNLAPENERAFVVVIMLV